MLFVELKRWKCFWGIYKLSNRLSKLVRTGSSVVLLSTLLFGTQASASTLNNLKEEQKQVEQKKSEINKQINEKKNAIQSNQTKQDKLLKQILTLNKKIVSTENNIDEVNTKINKTNKEIEELKSDIKELENKIANREKLIDERLRAVQVSGSISYIDVLLGANSFVDFIDRFSAVSTLMDADREIINEQAEDKFKLEETENKLNEKLASLETNKGKLVSLKTKLNSQKVDKKALITELEAEQAKLEKSKKNLETSYAEMYQISEELTSKITAEQKRIAALARQDEQNKNANYNSGSAALPATSSGTWTAPTYGRFTSNYGYRTFDNSKHLGVDVANSVGTPIVAAADGIVSHAGPLAGFGNLVMITHSINGQTFITLYGHLSSYNVSVGQRVSKGEQIANMGSTGNSTGPHLHFELHIGSWDWRGSTSVNPLRYVPFN